MSEINSTDPSRTDLEKLKTMSDEDIDTSEIPELGDEFFADAELRLPKGKVPVLLSVDEEIAEWFRQQDGDFRLNMSEALRSFADSHR